MISQNNKFMGGVDLADNMLASIRIRGKKWWWRIFSIYIDVCIVNAWKLWLDIHHQKKTSLLDFRRQVTVKLLNSACVPSAFALENSRPSSSTLLHFLKHIFCNKNVAAGNATAKTRFLCGTCGGPLHQHCNALYHKN